MPDATVVIGILLVAGTILGLAGVAQPAFFSVWTGTREHYLEVVAGHRLGWRLVNAGFVLATIATAGALAALAAQADPTTGSGALLAAIAVAYALGGMAWVIVLAVRTARDPVLASLVAAGTPTEPVESLLGAATGGLFGGFAVTTTLALIALGLVLWADGIVAVPVAVAIAVFSALCLAVQLRTGDCIPALLYLPTLLLGVALLLGWR